MVFALLGSLALTLGWLVPNHYDPWVSFYNESLAGVGVCLCALGLLPGRQFRLPLAIWSPAALLGAALALDVAADRLLFRTDLWAGTLFLGLWIVAGLVGANLVVNGGRQHGCRPRSNDGAAPRCDALTLLATTLVLGALGNVAAGTLQWLSLPTGLMVAGSSGRALSNLAQPNHYATLLAMALASLGYLKACGWIGVKLLWIAGSLLALATLTSDSRTGFLSLILVLALWLLRALRLNKSRREALGIGLALALLLLAKASFQELAVGLTGIETRAATDFQSQSRLLIWRQLLAAVAEHPWGGYGWLQVSAAQDLTASAYPGARLVSYAHSLPLDLVLWFGVPFAILMTGLCVGWLGIHARVKEPAKFHPMVMLCPLVLHSLLEFPYAYVYFMVPIAVLVGYVSRIHDSPALSVSGWLMGALVLFCVALGAAFFLAQTRAEEPMRSALSGESAVLRPIGGMLAIGDDLSALISTLSDRRANDLDALERARRVSLRYPRVAVKRQYVIVLVIHGEKAEACRQMAIFRRAYSEEEYEKLLTSIRSIAGKVLSCAE